MIAPESTTVPSRSKRTLSNRMRRSYRRAHRPLAAGVFRRASAARPPTLPASVGSGPLAEVSQFRYLVVPHTHWDREWYLPFECFRLRLGSVVEGVLDMLEGDPSFTSFTLDGQAIVLEDYVEVLPDNADGLRALLDSGRRHAGSV